MRQRITLLGFLFSVATGLVGLAAFLSANNLLFLLLAALLATFLVSGFISRLGLAGLEIDLLLPDQIAAKQKVLAQLVLKNGKTAVPSFSLTFSGGPESGLSEEIYVPVIPGGATLKEPLDLMFPRRGLYRDNVFYLTSKFPFGFTQRRALIRLEREVLVYPCVDAQAGFDQLLAEVTGDIESQQRGRSDDFYRIRPYEPQESARHVDWKATAHTGDLQVREFAREQDETVTILLDLDVSPEHAAWFERAIECCAFLAWRLTMGGTGLHFITQQFDQRVPEEASAYTILRYLALVEPVRGLDVPSSDDDRTFQVCVTARPDRLGDANWHPDRLLTPDNFGREAAGQPAAGSAPGHSARKDIDHRR
jgi:uncharacterized protein (DUF58 family)